MAIYPMSTNSELNGIELDPDQFLYTGLFYVQSQRDNRLLLRDLGLYLQACQAVDHEALGYYADVSDTDYYQTCINAYNDGIICLVPEGTADLTGKVIGFTIGYEVEAQLFLSVEKCKTPTIYLKLNKWEVIEDVVNYYYRDGADFDRSKLPEYTPLNSRIVQANGTPKQLLLNKLEAMIVSNETSAVKAGLKIFLGYGSAGDFDDGFVQYPSHLLDSAISIIKRDYDEQLRSKSNPQQYYGSFSDFYTYDPQ